MQKVLERRGLRQFVKFCIVGASSTLIDFAVFLLLIEGFHLGSRLGNPALARILAASASFLVAVSNGFFWNNRWTFRKSEEAGAGNRYAKFLVTNMIGLGLNLLILSLVAHLIPREISGLLASHLHDPEGFIGKLAATGVVVFWNFTASKYWTFAN